uniref:Uncharacterized protein n=1 Tax=Micrurus lemniscatus lemniscatus TaxID=129467 RepID=A0A2D4H792_MICLE
MGGEALEGGLGRAEREERRGGFYLSRVRVSTSWARVSESFPGSLLSQDGKISPEEHGTLGRGTPQNRPVSLSILPGLPSFLGGEKLEIGRPPSWPVPLAEIWFAVCSSLASLLKMMPERDAPVVLNSLSNLKKGSLVQLKNCGVCYWTLPLFTLFF